jgi:SPP1 gp7 family putative phage head morphogenesis protein
MAIFEEYETHPQRLRPLRTAMEERLLRAFAGLINQLRQQDLGTERYIWRSQDDAKVRDSHAEYDDQVFRWEEPPAGGHPGQAHNCRCFAEPIASGSRNDVVLAELALPAEAPVGALLRRLGLRAVAITPLGTAALAALAASGALQEFTRLATERRLQRAAEILGVDPGSAEGLLAAMAHELVQESVISGLGSSLPKSVEAAQIAGQAAALYEMLNPGTIVRVIEGDPAAQLALGDFVQQAYNAFAEGRLRLQDGTIAQGWVEVFPELTEGERRLGELPGFTPERIEQWLETYPAEVLGLPTHTGSPAPEDPTGNIISTPIPDAAGPNIVESRGGGDFTTPAGHTVQAHGSRGSGEEYLTGKGHTPESVDEIIENPTGTYPASRGDTSTGGRQGATILFGPNGDWVLVNDETGAVIQVNDRYNRRQEPPW